MRTNDEINAEIAALKELKPRVRRTTAFGDDNHAAIDAQIQALTDRMDEDGLYDSWPEEEGDECRERDCARDAVDWMNGESDERPSEGWT
jgi:ArsR family metal-binding transcriptional regulator